MNLFQRILVFWITLLLLAGCQASTPAPTLPAAPITATVPVTAVPTSTAAPTFPPTATTRPTKTPRPTRTPKPTPTLPAGDILSCIPQDTERVSAVVVRVTDGDTIMVQVGHDEFNVRYLGLDTPETYPPPAEWLGPEATARNRELVGGRRITLVADSKADNKDRYDRLLRYIIVDDLFVNYQLVREGFARYYTSPNACGATFYQAEQAAREDDLGLWGPKP